MMDDESGDDNIDELTGESSSSHMRVMNHIWSATKHRYLFLFKTG